MPLYTSNTPTWLNCGSTDAAGTHPLDFSYDGPSIIVNRVWDGATTTPFHATCVPTCLAPMDPPYDCGDPQVDPGSGTEPDLIVIGGVFYCVCIMRDNRTLPPLFPSPGGQPAQEMRNCSGPCERYPPNHPTPGTINHDWEGCECLYCAHVGDFYDPATGLCYACPAGMCYCHTVGDCVNCTPPACSAQLNCVWDLATCVFDCNTPSCPPGQSWNVTHCRCEVGTGPPPAPPCSTALHCVLNTDTNTWACDDPATVCGAGNHWDWPSCSCMDNCPVGQCWCVGSGCIECKTPPCTVERGCSWNQTLCKWDCTDPTCPDGQHFSYRGCTCRDDADDDTPWLIQAGPHWHEQALSRDGQVIYQRIQDSVPSLPLPFSVPVADVPSGATDDCPRMVVDWMGRRVLTFRRTSGGSSKTMLTGSDDDGDTWSDPVDHITASNWPTINVDYDNGLILTAALRSGVPTGRLRDRGDSGWSAEFSFQVSDGSGGLMDLVLDDKSFHFQPAIESPNRLIMHAIQGGNSKLWLSSDDYLTWEEL